VTSALNKSWGQISRVVETLQEKRIFERAAVKRLNIGR
jgi:hypothetical protein